MDADGVGLVFPCACLQLEVGSGVGCILFVDGDVAEVLYFIVLVEHDDRDGVVAAQDFEYQRQIGGLVGLVERLHGLCPYLHLAVFLGFEVGDQKVGHHQRCHTQDHGHEHKGQFHLSYAFYPVHGGAGEARGVERWGVIGSYGRS